VAYYDSFLYIDEKKLTTEVWIVMEWLRGGTLREASQAYRLMQNHMAYVAFEILTGLQYLHNNHWVHRDLKSSNIMMDTHGWIKLIDFGLLVDIKNGPAIGMAGTPSWMAPEIVCKKPYGYPVDIYSLGVCLLELHNGNPPYGNNSLTCMFKAATSGVMDLIPDNADDRAKDFVRKCLSMDPDQRPPISDLLTHPWLTQPNLDEGIQETLDAIFLVRQMDLMF